MSYKVRSVDELFEELGRENQDYESVMVKGVNFIKIETDDEPEYFLRTDDEYIYTSPLINVRSEITGSSTIGELKTTGETKMLDEDGIHDY